MVQHDDSSPRPGFPPGCLSVAAADLRAVRRRIQSEAKPSGLSLAQVARRVAREEGLPAPNLAGAVCSQGIDKDAVHVIVVGEVRLDFVLKRYAFDPGAGAIKMIGSRVDIDPFSRRRASVEPIGWNYWADVCKLLQMPDGEWHICKCNRAESRISLGRLSDDECDFLCRESGLHAVTTGDRSDVASHERLMRTAVFSSLKGHVDRKRGPSRRFRDAYWGNMEPWFERFASLPTLTPTST